MRIFEGYQRGINLGGWISQFDTTLSEDALIKHFNEFITEEDIKYIADHGFDHVRVPVDYNVLEDEEGNIKPEGFEYLAKCREWCESLGLRMGIDLHECYGYSFDPLKKDMDRHKFFYDEELQARFFKLWTEIATRFSAYPEQVAFEPLNEVVPQDVAEAWNGVLTKFIHLIREIAPHAYIIAGGVCYNNVLSVPLLDIPHDERVVYNFHCYEPMIFTHQGAYWVENMPLDFRIGYPKTLEEYKTEGEALTAELAGAVYKEGISEIGPKFFEDIFAPAIAKASEDDVALYCGEFGVIDRAAEDDKNRWLADIHEVFDKYGIGNAEWNYKEKDFGIRK